MATIETAYYVPTFLGLSTTFGISCAISASCIIAFEVYKRFESMQCLFAPKSHLFKNSIPALPNYLFSWATCTFSISEQDLLQRVGLDAIMHIRFLRMAVHFLVFQSLIVCPILLGLHWTGSASQQQAYSDHFRSNSTLYYLSIANIKSHDPVVWTHVFFTYFISLTWLWLLFANHVHHIHLLHQQPRQLLHKRTVLVTRIPPHLRTKETLEDYFMKQGQVESVELIPHKTIRSLDTLLKKRQKLIDELELTLIQMARKRIHSDGSNDWDQWILQLQEYPEYTTITDILSEVEAMDKDILEQRTHISDDVTASAFVTFKRNQSAQVTSQIVTSSKPGILHVRMAPEPRDILWKHLLRKGRKSRLLGGSKKWLVSVAVWSLTIFWLFPITFILSLTSISSLTQHFPFLEQFIVSSFVVRAFIQNILPTMLVTLCMSILPSILLELSKQQDFISYSELEDTVLGRHYHFAIFNVLIVFLLGTTFLSTILDVVYEPTMLIQLLANALPQGANFFLNYILFNSSTHAMELVLLGSQLFGHLFFVLPFVSKTPRLKLRYTTPWSFPYYYYYPAHILVLVITLTYSVIQPLILTFAVLYFAFALVVYRHQYLYCYLRKYESDGSRHYRRMARYTSDGLLIFQMTVVGILYLKGVLTAATAVLPLIIFTAWAKIRLHTLFHDRTKHVSSIYDPSASFSHSSSWIDDIWKLSLIKSWYLSGRYEGQEQGNDATSEITTVAIQQPCHKPQQMLDVIHVKVSYTRTEYVMTDNLNMYPDDSCSAFETYQHPVFYQPLDKHLILPRRLNSSFWKLNECTLIPLDRFHNKEFNV